MKHRHLITGAVTSLGILMSSLANASSHREAPYTATDPSADNTDVYAWVDANGNLVIVANYIGLELPEGGPNWVKFSDDVLYEIHMVRGPTSLNDVVDYQFQFTSGPGGNPPLAYPYDNPAASPPIPTPAGGLEFFAQLSGGGAFAQTYTVTKVENGRATVLGTGLKVPPPNVGPTTNTVAYGLKAGETYESHFVDTAATSAIATLKNGEGRVFAGPRDDPFYVDLGAVFDLAQVRPVSNLLSAPQCTVGGMTGQCAPRDSVAYQNVHSLVLEIPGAMANGGKAPVAGANADQTVGIWASASRQMVRIRYEGQDEQAYGPWRQVSRLGISLINETIIGLQDKDNWNRSRPSDDAPTFGAYFDNLIAARDAQAVGFYGNALQVCNIENGGPPLTNRLADVVPVINLAVDGQHVGAQAITSVGDVLRVDLGQRLSDFPNGRRLDTSGTATGNTETVDVVDTELKLLFCTLTNATVNASAILGPNKLAPNTPYGGVPDGVNFNETNFRTSFPYLASPWEGWHASPHAPPAI